MNLILCESSERTTARFNAGSKARRDVLEIARRAGYKHISLFTHGASKIKKLFQAMLAIFRVVFMATKGDKVFLQYPYRPRLVDTTLLEILPAVCSAKGAELIILVHDIDALRDRSSGEFAIDLKAEMSFLSRADLVICHTEAMKRELKKGGLTSNIAVLGPFDYLYSGAIACRQWSARPVVSLAGNLKPAKAGYVYKLGDIPKVTFELFGAGYEADLVNEERGSNIRYRGKCSPEELVEKLGGQFGLVWDGPSIDTCEGLNGDYLRYNSPHKLSLYLVAGLPVIVWKESALAPFVVENGVGITVDSLVGLDRQLANIGEIEYGRMTQQVRRFAQGMAAGERLSKFL